LPVGDNAAAADVACALASRFVHAVANPVSAAATASLRVHTDPIPTHGD
jgi:hypothetical protein